VSVQERQTQPDERSWDSPGGLTIRDRRSWKTWQLITAMTASLIAGMAIAHTGSGAASAAGDTTPLYSLQPQASSSTAPTASAAPTTSREAPVPLKTGPAVILLPNTNGKGAKTLATFSAGGAWKIGYAFDCSAAAGGTGYFRVFVENVGVSATTPAIDKTARSGSGIASQTTTGEIRIHISADAACRWAVKATGVKG
jgi:hypothetical protein